ncbi:uncharacterized protein LOC120274938 [Dioscorea cayenensis subsp. rotundata]|uniref:Uncharacterized protein LOC120274938 n=1 Tax=Dioscorea cayennensis subsp. rotundata TaxID=55577 RepID=A0AB40CC22_DIOCR|nr:uncharacterized protein LOC120274938 [Dioscorea cayenensis subsp. rotundata]
MEVPKKSNTAKRLADDILINILIRLPPKSLCKFMVISKAWHSLISDAYWEKFQVSTKIGTSFIPYSRRVYLNGIIHIVASKRHVVAIDLDSMVCRRIEMPVIKPLIRNALLGNLTRSLHYADKRNKEMNIWMLKDYESGEWVLKHSVVFEVGFNVMAFHPEMDIVFLRMLNNKIMSYKMSNGELKEVCKLRHKSMRGFFVFSPFFGEDVLESKFGV